MGKQDKSFLCMYVDDFCGIKKESFNFNIEKRYVIREGAISRLHAQEITDFPADFWGKNISAITLLIGENGAGKTTLMRLLIKWLCQLSVGHIPQEKGAFVISVDHEDKLIAFDKGEPWKIETKGIENIVYIEDINEIKELLGDIRLVYYTDTMTDLDLSDTLTAEELKFLKDDSLLTRLSDSMESKYTVDSIKHCIKREDFKRQMNLFLHGREKFNISEFPIRYMKLTTIKAGDEKGFHGIPDGNGKLTGEAVDFWNKVFDDEINNNLLPIARELLWGLFSGVIISLLSWEKALPYWRENIVAEQIRPSLRAYITTDDNAWNTVFSHFFKNVFTDFKNAFGDAQHHIEFRNVWDSKVEDKINSFLKALKSIEKGEFWEKWRPFENAQNIWEFELELFDEKGEQDKSILEEWNIFWESYLTVAHLMPACRFDWKYDSSGGNNQSNLFVNLFNIVDECLDSGTNQLWILLDEPDNALHPDWKRRMIQNLLETCSNNDFKIQLLISTHSPIMLSDVPRQAAILLRIKELQEKEKKIKQKQQVFPKTSSFGQQIYTLFNDAFFMEQGIIGAFADLKIEKIYKDFFEIEDQLAKGTDIQEKIENFEQELKDCKCIIKMIDEPLLHGHLSQSYMLCNRKIRELRNYNLYKEGTINDQNETI